MSEFTLEGFAKFITSAGMAEALSKAQHHALEEACVVIETEAKRVIGTYDYGWKELADSTKADRVAQGFPENEPGLRTGEMRDLIGHKVIDANLAYVGSDNDKLVFFELGTVRQPPRSVLGAAAAGAEKEIHSIIGTAVGAAIASRNVDAALVALLIHTAEKVAHNVARAFAETDHRQDRDR